MSDDRSTASETDGAEKDATEKYVEVDPEDVVEDAIDLLSEGADDPTPVTPPPPDDETPPPPNA